MNARQIVLDTETTGMNKDHLPHYENHRIIEIGGVEMINRRLTGRHFHYYFCPDRQVDEEAFQVHGISDDFLKDKPKFEEKFTEFIDFIRDSELIIHNAPFDVGFLDHEIRLMNETIQIEKICKITDSLTLARSLFPGKRNNLDALCERYHIDNSRRTLHGALLDAEILADIYLMMTGGQVSLFQNNIETNELNSFAEKENKIEIKTHSGKIIFANDKENQAHKEFLDLMRKKNNKIIWQE